MHLRSPAGPISVYVLNPPEHDNEASSSSTMTTASDGHSRTVSQADPITRGGRLGRDLLRGWRAWGFSTPEVDFTSLEFLKCT